VEAAAAAEAGLNTSKVGEADSGDENISEQGGNGGKTASIDSVARPRLVDMTTVQDFEQQLLLRTAT
jgi:hypothetical protein